MSLMGEGIKNVEGGKLESVLWKVSGTPAKGVLMGTVVTSIIQSSSATTIMMVGFVNAGIMQVFQAIGVIMGANIGTSITGWILCLSYLGSDQSGLVQLFSTATLTAVVALIGIALRMFGKRYASRHVGDIMLGFAVLLFGMQVMSSSVAPLKQNEAFVSLLTRFSNPFLGILVGIAVTVIIQSNSAAVGILQALSITGAIKFSSAFPIILGMGIGAAAPVLLSAIGVNKNSKRTALIYLLNDLFGAIIWGSAFYITNAFFRFDFMNLTMGPVSIAILNSAFRIATVAVLMPCVPLLEKLVFFLIKDTDGKHAPNLVDRLDERLIEHPAVAIDQCREALNDMAYKAKQNIVRAFELLSNYSESGYSELQEKENEVDHYEDKIGTYLVKLTGKELTRVQTQVISKFLHTISDFERISDHSVNLSEAAKEIFEKKSEFSSEAKRELRVIEAAVAEIVSISFEAFANEDMDLAYHVEPLAQMINVLCDEVKLHHINRVQRGTCTLNLGFVFNDLLTNYERVSDHCSNIAVAMIELQSDSFDTHEYLNRVKSLRTGVFEQYFDEYSKRFTLNQVKQSGALSQL
jgi:phosphate:Na+ symporter